VYRYCDRQTDTDRQSSNQGRERPDAKMDMNIVLDAMTMGKGARRESSVVHGYCKMQVLSDRMNICACECADRLASEIK
jgi:hypothetical protein